MFAARIGRATAQEARLDVRFVVQERERNRAFGKDLKLKRDKWLQDELERKADDDARRLVVLFFIQIDMLVAIIHNFKNYSTLSILY